MIPFVVVEALCLANGPEVTQGDLAHASGISKVYLRTVERAEKGASIEVEVLEKLARGLAVTPAELLRFGARGADAGPEERLGNKVASLARGASPGKLARFEVIARATSSPRTGHAAPEACWPKGATVMPPGVSAQVSEIASRAR